VVELKQSSSKYKRLKTMSSSIPIVQGVPVPPKSDYQYNSVSTASAPNQYYHVSDVPPSQQQDMQQLRASPIKQFQDVIWAILFILHLIGMITFIIYGLMNPNADGVNITSMNSSIIFLTCVTGLTSVSLSSMALSVMMQHAKLLVEVGLIFSVATSLVIAIFGFMTGSIMMGVLGIVSFFIGCCYTYAVWSRIPFAAANLNTALSAVRDNMGLTVVSFIFTLIAFAWSILWFLGVGSAYAGSNGAVIFSLVRYCFLLMQCILNS
jgi:hypothetical protein